MREHQWRLINMITNVSIWQPKKNAFQSRNHSKFSLSASKKLKKSNFFYFAVSREREKKNSLSEATFLSFKIVVVCMWFFFFLMYLQRAGRRKWRWEEKMRKDVFHSTNALFDCWIVIAFFWRSKSSIHADKRTWCFELFVNFFSVFFPYFFNAITMSRVS